MFGGIRRLFSRCGKTALVLALVVGVGLALHAVVPSVAFAAGYKPPDSSWSLALVNFVGTTLAQIIDFIAGGLGSLTLVVIEVIVVNVLNYNNFSSSNIVTLGWTLTRDMVNMFAVIVLLILAVKTMVGQTANAWQQHLPRFFLGIVFANFSRTLCGLAVDASQIVMMTFVNALMSIAAGNFAQLMVMPQATTYSSATLQGATEAGISLITLASNIANAYAKMMVTMVVLCVILLLAIAFIWRIVVLWIAIIMAPLAAFSWGSKEIVGFLGRLYQEWMAKFIPPLVLGPMLAFFLYLALAASSNGNLAKAEAFPEPEKRTTYGQITLEIFESTNFAGLLLAVVFLLMGLKESASTAAKMGGLASKMFNEKTAGRVFRAGGFVTGATVGNVAKLSARGALKAGSLAGSGLELIGDKLGNRYGSGRFGSVVRNAGMIAGAAGSLARRADEQVRLIPTDVSKMPDYAKNRGAALAKAGSELTTKLGGTLTEGANFASGKAGVLGEKIAGKVGANAGNSKKFGDMVKNASMAGMLAIGPNALRSAGSALSAQEHHISEEEAKAAKERVGHMTQEEKAARLQQFLDGTGDKSLEAQADAQNIKGLLLTDKNFEKEFEKTSGGKFEDNMDEILKQLQHEADGGHLSIDKETWNKTRSKYADAYARVSPTNADKFIDSEDFNGRLMRGSAVSDAAVIAALGKSSSGKTENGRIITKLEELNRGNYGSDKLAAAHAATMPIFAAGTDKEEMVRMFSRGGAGHLTQANLSNAAVVESLIQGNVKPANLATEEVSREAAAAAAAGRAPTITSASVQQEFASQVMQTQEVENITKAFDNKQFDESHVSDTMFNSATNPNADKAVLALARSEKMDFSKMNAAAVNQINTQLAAMEAAGGRISTDDAGVLRKKMLQAGKTVSDVIPGVDPNPATNPTMSLGGAERVKTQQLFRADPSSIAQVDPAVVAAAGTGGNAFSEAVVQGLSKEDFKKLGDMFSKETNAARKAVIKNAMDTIDRALKVYEAKYTTDLAALETKRKAAATPSAKKDAEREISEYKNRDEYKQAQRVRSDHKSTDRYMI